MPAKDRLLKHRKYWNNEKNMLANDRIQSKQAILEQFEKYANKL